MTSVILKHYLFSLTWTAQESLLGWQLSKVLSEGVTPGIAILSLFIVIGKKYGNRHNAKEPTLTWSLEHT
jgi:hypothetical protein